MSNSTSGGSATAISQKQDSGHSYQKKKPPPLDESTTRMKMASQDSTANTLPSASSGQKTPPVLTASDITVKEKKIGHRRVDEQTGQVTYKKKATSDLMTAIQLGIQNSVGSLTSKPNRDVLMQDFSVVETVYFPEDGSKLTPAHRAGDFKFKTYAPVAFRYFRELFGIQTDDFLISLTSNPLTELSNPGASGSVFFITEDDEFIIKTVQHKEADFLQKLLPGYYMNLNQNPRTLLPKFYGLYCLQAAGKNIRLCVMNNLLPRAIHMSEKYDLKGSTYKRKASKHELAKSSPTFKDLDFKDKNQDGIYLEADTYDALLKTMRRDCRVLESFKIMDYSLLLAAHNVDETKKRRSEERAGLCPPAITEGSRTHQLSPVSEQPSTSDSAGAYDAQGAEARFATPVPVGKGNRSTKARLAHFSTAMESIQAETEPVEVDDEDVPPGGIPARNAKGERLLLYAGVIDILQSYRLKKKLEHGFKSIVHDGDSISVHRPSFYATRFLTFFEKEVFKKVASLQQMKKLPAIQHVIQPGFSSPAAIRSPSKKKTTRQRSLTDPTATENLALSHDPAGSTGVSGGILHSSKPDLIPQQSATSYNAEAPNLTSTHTFSDRSMNYAVGPSSSAGTGSSLPPTRDSHAPPPLPPDDTLPPYSEEPHTYEKTTETSLHTSVGGARSKFSSSPQINTARVQTVSGIGVSGADKSGEDVQVTDEGVQTTVPPVDNGGQKPGSFRKDKDRPDLKKGVRFSMSEEDEEQSSSPTSDQTDSSVAKIPSDKPLSREDGSGAAAPADDIPESEDSYTVLKPPTASDLPLTETNKFNSSQQNEQSHQNEKEAGHQSEADSLKLSAHVQSSSAIEIEKPADDLAGNDNESNIVNFIASQQQADGSEAVDADPVVSQSQHNASSSDILPDFEASVDSASIELRIIEDGE